MSFWAMAYKRKAINKETLRKAVKCEENPFGEITPEEFEEICGEKF
ncbi:XkdX family protein [Clostridium perfringens]